MDNRKYNLFFHLHTISGISISVMLFVIFFAGAFTLFQNEINEWEQYDLKKDGQTTQITTATYLKAFEKVKREFPQLYGRGVSMYEHDGGLAVNVGPSADSALKPEQMKGGEFIYHAKEDKFEKHGEYYGSGTLLYWLHFYWQFGQIGYLIAGFVSLFFFLAIVTGILVHWKKIVSNFFTFRPAVKWKTIWTDAHTALGVIGLPFQFLYALTGSFFGLGLLMSSTVAITFFDGNTEEFYRKYYPQHEIKLGKANGSEVDLAYYVEKTENRWKGFEVGYLNIINIGSDSARVLVNGQLPVEEEFLGMGEVLYDVSSGKEVHVQDPYATNYINNSRNWIYKVHYANYGDIGTTGNVLLKTGYFLMALLTCFVIITGVMIWLTARDKKGLDPKKRKWNSGVGYFYLASCLSMFPLVAYTMIVAKFSETHTENYLNYVFFSMWLAMSVGLSLLRDNKRIFRLTLVSGGVLSLLVPIVSGFSGNWFWLTFNTAGSVFAVDIIFLLLAVTAFFAMSRVSVSQKQKPNVVTDR